MSEAVESPRARASRANARKSTGPRSAAGKARIGRNARRHGLTLPVLKDPALAPEVDDLARQVAQSVAGAAPDAYRHALACRIAEAMIDLRRVRAVKLPLLAALTANPADAAVLRRLARLDRYERHALWRRKVAVRAFDAASRCGTSRISASEADDRQEAHGPTSQPASR